MSKVFPGVSSDKLAFIRSGKRRKSLTGFKANKKISSNEEGKFEVIQKEKKFEEAGVTKTKRNYVMFESKLGTEREVDLNKIAGAQKVDQSEEMKKKYISKRKRKNIWIIINIMKLKILEKIPYQLLLSIKDGEIPLEDLLKKQQLKKLDLLVLMFQRNKKEEINQILEEDLNQEEKLLKLKLLLLPK